MAVGQTAFKSDSEENLIRNIIQGEIVYPLSMSVDMIDLISNLCNINIEYRLTDPAAIKNHPFFNGIDWKALKRKEVQPPYIPNVAGPTDLTLIDSEFLDCSIENFTANSSIDDSFEGFSEANPLSPH